MVKKKLPEPVVEEAKPWSITQLDMESITDEEALRGTTRFLPKEEEIPIEHWGWFKGVRRNIYFRIAEAMYVGEPPPMGHVTFHPGFTGKDMQRFLKAHMHSVYPEYQHKMAGMAYMIATMATITDPEETK